MLFVGRGARRGRGGPPGFTRFPRLVEPALLYLLVNRGGAHGYDLIDQVNRLAICDTEVDAGAVYRALRDMEDNGLVRSTWDTTRRGPAKRDYEVTQTGIAHLKAWADILRRRGEMMVAFADDCDNL